MLSLDSDGLELYLYNFLVHVPKHVVTWSHHSNIVDNNSNLMVEPLHLLHNLANVTSIREVSHNGGSLHLVKILDLIADILQLLFVSTDQDNVEALLGQGQGILSSNALEKYFV